MSLAHTIALGAARAVCHPGGRDLLAAPHSSDAAALRATLAESGVPVSGMTITRLEGTLVLRVGPAVRFLCGWLVRSAGRLSRQGRPLFTLHSAQDPAGAARRLADSRAAGGAGCGWDEVAVGVWPPDADQRYLIALRQELAGRGVRCELEDRGPWPRLRVYCPDEGPTAEFDNNVIAAPLRGQWCFCWPAAVPIGPVTCLAQVAADIIGELGLGDGPGGGPGQAVASLPVWRMLGQMRQSISRPRLPGRIPAPHECGDAAAPDVCSGSLGPWARG